MRSELAAAEDRLFAVLPRAAGDAALGGHARLADRLTSAVGSAFAAAERVVDRVHRLGSRVRADAHVARAAGLAEVDVDPVEVAELTNGRAASALHAAHLTGRENDHRPLPFLGAETSHATGGADQLPALAGVHLHVVNLKSRRDVRQGHRIADVRRSIGAASDGGADLQPVGGEDVSLLAVLVLDQGNV